MLFAELDSALLESRILGGNQVTEGTYTYVVNVQEHHRHKCGGALISASHVLTAGHCVFGIRLQDISVIVGSYYRESRIIRHEIANKLISSAFCYRHPAYFDDLAILIVSHSLNIYDN